MGKEKRPFCCHQNFVPNGLSAPAQGYIHMVKHEKMYIKSDLKKPRRKVYLYQKGDLESMRKDAFEFAKEKYFNGHSDTRLVQENFDLITSFIQNSADKHIPSKTSCSVSSVPWITPEIRRKIHRKNAKAKTTGSSKLRSKFETL